MLLKIGYNTQRNNDSFGGKFPSWNQCFTTSAIMFMSYFTPSIKAEDDITLAKYLDDVEDTIGNAGIGEEIARRDHIQGSTSYWWSVQQAGITKWLNNNGIQGKALFKESVHSLTDLPGILDKHGPVILATDKMGGLPGGHIILAIGYDSTGIIFNDPFGNATTGYQNTNGANVLYSYEFLMKATIVQKPDKIRCMYWQPTTIV